MPTKCSQCGAEITVEDQPCPQCGKHPPHEAQIVAPPAPPAAPAAPIPPSPPPAPPLPATPINRSYQTVAKTIEITTSKSPCEALEKYVNQLHLVYESWYGCSKQRIGLTWQLLQLLSYVAGFASSLIAALFADKPEYKPALIVLPLVGSFATSLIVQFRHYEVTQAREQGRIAFQTLSEEGRQRLAAATTEEECAAIHADLTKKATDIENLQSNAFFGFFKLSAKPN